MDTITVMSIVALQCVLHVYTAGFCPGRDIGIVGGHGLGGVCVHINRLPSHIKVKLTVKAWWATIPKGPWENTALVL